MHWLLILASALAQSSPADLGYRLVADWAQLPAGWNFGEVAGVDTDARGHVYVFHRGPHPILEFDGDGKFLRSWGDGMITRAHSVRIDPQGNIWIVDVGAHVVLKMNPQGRVAMVLGRQGQAGVTRALFDQPADVAFASNGDFYVADGYGNSRVVKFAGDGRYILEWGKKGQARGEFDLPHAVLVDPRGRVYVSDRSNQRIQVFDAAGTFLAEWTHVGSLSGLDWTPDGRMLGAGGSRVLLLNLEGQILGSLAPAGRLPGQLLSAHGVAAGPGGEIYVAELNWRLQKFVRK